MVVRQLRWIAASVAVAVAFFASPAQSKADIQIQVQELDGSGNAFGPLSTFFQAGTGSFNLPSSFSTASFNVTSIGSTPTNNGSLGTLSTTVLTTPTSSFDPSHSLRVIVTSDGFTNPTPGGTGTLVNDPGISTSRLSDANSNTGMTELLTGKITLNTLAPFSPPLVLEDTQASGGGDALSSAIVDVVPGQYTIRQTLTIKITPNGSLNGTFTDTLSSSLDANPPEAVPAPGGLVLALIALPLIGLRRTLRKRAAV